MRSSRRIRAPSPRPAGTYLRALRRRDAPVAVRHADGTAKYATCLDLSTVLTLAASPITVPLGGTTTLTATLKVVDYDAYVRLGGNPISSRVVTLQRRAPGATGWTIVGAMPAGAGAGTYVLTQRPQVDTEYRAVFATPADEGINGDTAPTVRVYASTCTAVATTTGTIDVPCL
jgi:hypothetical protein